MLNMESLGRNAVTYYSFYVWSDSQPVPAGIWVQRLLLEIPGIPLSVLSVPHIPSWLWAGEGGVWHNGSGGQTWFANLAPQGRRHRLWRRHHLSRLVVYCCLNCQFRTFLLDSELERVECGITAVEDKRGSLTSHHKSVDTGSDNDTIYAA